MQAGEGQEVRGYGISMSGHHRAGWRQGSLERKVDEGLGRFQG